MFLKCLIEHLFLCVNSKDIEGDCCEIEFGYEDRTFNSANNYRKKWLEKGSPWFYSKEKPENWNLQDQLQNVPDNFCKKPCRWRYGKKCHLGIFNFQLKVSKLMDPIVHDGCVIK
ncbi:hypothetical protein BS333_03435 [Vibrio azureus]|nr:hypothetical protein BS333_03435 [Vibrio azureus]